MRKIELCRKWNKKNKSFTLFLREEEKKDVLLAEQISDEVVQQIVIQAVKRLLISLEWQVETEGCSPIAT